MRAYCLIPLTNRDVTWHGIDIESAAVASNHGADNNERHETPDCSGHEKGSSTDSVQKQDGRQGDCMSARVWPARVDKLTNGVDDTIDSGS
jgi:hypothetical protein